MEPLSKKEKYTLKTSENGTCPYCHGVGYVRLNVPVGHPAFGKAIPCICKRQEIRQRRLEKLRRISNLIHLKHMTFDSFEVHRGSSAEVSMSLQEALDVAREYAENPQGWLVFTGPYGCGKTHLAAAIANYCIEHGRPALFVVVPDLLDYLRAAYAPNSEGTYDERFDQVRNIPLLILDDLGTQHTTPWAAEKLYQILNYRYNAELPTVITTNQPFLDMDPRLVSRLQDSTTVRTVPIYAQDYRMRAKDVSFGSLDLYSGCTFETFSLRTGELKPSESRQLKRASEIARAYADQPLNWLVFRGGYGVGKTHLAAAAANRIAARGMNVVFVMVSDLLDYLRATFQPNSAVTYDQRFNEIRRAWLLVLDDMGVHNATPWAREKLFQILNYRYVGGLATIITISNNDWERLDARLKSRLEDTSLCTIVDINVPSYRGTPQNPRPRRSTRKRL